VLLLFLSFRLYGQGNLAFGVLDYFYFLHHRYRELLMIHSYFFYYLLGGRGGRKIEVGDCGLCLEMGVDYASRTENV
jgi:hypothetical protein